MPTASERARLRGKTFVRILLAFLLYLAAASGAHAFQNVDTAAPKKGAIHGHVVESASGDPVRKATVILRRGQEPGIGALSDVSGASLFDDLELGAYMVSVERTGFILDLDSERAVANVQPEPAVAEITVKLIRSAAISGASSIPKATRSQEPTFRLCRPGSRSGWPSNSIA